MEVLDPTPRKLKVKQFPWEPLNIIPIGDIQYGSPGTDIKRLQATIKQGMDIGAYFLGTGDYSDFLSPSNRKYLSNAGLYDTAADLIEAWHAKHLDELKEILAPTRGMWLGLLEGHHFLDFSDGTTTDTELCRFLGAPFLGTCAVLRLQFSYTGKTANAESFIWCHHGVGGGNDPLLKLFKIEPGFPQVQVFIQGHNTQLDARPKDTVHFYGSHGKLATRDFRKMFIAAGGYMQGYTAGSRHAGRAAGSYVERGMMRPTAIGAPLLTLEPRRHTTYNEVWPTCTV